jgi:hypothetical protein
MIFLLLSGFFSLALKPYQQGVNITLVSFEAETSDDQIDLYWETATEFDIFGFYIQRLDQNGTYTDISPLIPGEGDGSTGWYYFFSDTNVESDITYYYKLRVVNLDSTEEFYGPVWGTPGAPPTSTPTIGSAPTHTSTVTPTRTATFAPSPTGPTPTFTLTSTHSPVPSATFIPNHTNTVAAPVVTFTTVPSLTATPTETTTEGPTSTSTFTATTTLLPLPSITLIWPTDNATATPTAASRQYVTATRPLTATPGAEIDNAQSAIPLRVSFLAVIVGGLWLLLAAFLFTYLRRLGQ